NNFPPGPALVTVFTNGIPSDSKYLVVACPTAPTALKPTNVTAHGFTAKWKSVRGATGYRLDVSTSNSFTTYVPGYQDLDVGNTTNFPVTGLSAQTHYYYRVRAYNGWATSHNSNILDAQTSPCTPSAPNAQPETDATST